MAQVPSYSESSDTVIDREMFETDTTSGAIKAVVERVNVTQGSTSYVDPDSGAAYVPTGTVASKPLRIVTGRETVASTLLGATAATLTAPANSAYAEIHVYDASGITFTLDGTDPTATIGTRVNAGATFELESADEVADFKAFSLGAAQAIGFDVTYFNRPPNSGTAD